MITAVFEAMDADGDGVLSVNDVKAYFRTHLQHSNHDYNGEGNHHSTPSLSDPHHPSHPTDATASASTNIHSNASSEMEVRKWIARRDVDQDGAVGLAEFVASYAMQLDPASKVPSPLLRDPITSLSYYSLVLLPCPMTLRV